MRLPPTARPGWTTRPPDRRHAEIGQRQKFAGPGGAAAIVVEPQLELREGSSAAVSLPSQLVSNARSPAMSVFAPALWATHEISLIPPIRPLPPRSCKDRVVLIRGRVRRAAGAGWRAAFNIWRSRPLRSGSRWPRPQARCRPAPRSGPFSLRSQGLGVIAPVAIISIISILYTCRLEDR